MKDLKFKYVKDGTDPKSATSLEQLFGSKKTLNVGYSNSDELEVSLKGMNVADIQTLAVKLGIKPCSNRNQLVRACIDQFNRLTKTYGNAKTPKSEPVKDFDPSKF